MNAPCKTPQKPARPPRKTAARAPKRNRAQIFKYLNSWDEIFERWGWAAKPKAEKDDLRHSVNEDLFGEYVAPGGFSNGQWDVMFFALDVLLRNGILVWTPETAEFAREEGRRRVFTNLIERAGADAPDIELYGAPEEYVAHVARGKFATNDWRSLNSESLEQLFWTIKNRVRTAAKKGGSLYDAPAQKTAEENGDPF